MSTWLTRNHLASKPLVSLDKPLPNIWGVQKLFNVVDVEVLQLHWANIAVADRVQAALS